MSGHDVNVVFCRLVLKDVMAEVREHTTVEDRKLAWVYSYGRTWEFHGPGRFYWHGRADNAYHARSEGWMKWLEKNVPEAAHKLQEKGV